MYRYCICTFCALLLFLSCSKHNDNEQVKSVLYSVDFEKTYSAADLQSRDVSLLMKAMTLIGSPIVRSTTDSDPAKEILSIIGKYLSHNDKAIKFLKIKYRTVDANGQPTLASAAVFVPQVPDGEKKEYPILSVQHTSCQNRNASPSWLISRGAYYNIDEHITETVELRISEAFSNFGYIVVVSDNIGLGDNYCVYPFGMRTLGTPVVDAIRAVAELDAKTSSDAVFDGRNVSLIGYSEGGYVSMLAADILQNNYASEFNVQASACLAGCFSISKVMIKSFLEADCNYATPYIFPLFLNALSNQYSEQYPQFLLKNMIKEKAPNDDLFFTHLTGLMNSFEGSYLIDSLIIQGFRQEYAEKGPSVILTDEFTNMIKTDDPLLDSLMSLNDAYNWCPLMPLKMIHYTEDDMIPYLNSVVADSVFAELGSTSVEFETVYSVPNFFGDYMKHINAYFPILDKGFTWLDGVVHPND